MTASAAVARHVGLDLGATNLKWTVVERDAEDWRALDRRQSAVAGNPEEVVRQLAKAAGDAIERWPDISTVGVGVPGSYDPSTGEVGLTVNLGRAFMGQPLAAALSDAVGRPVALINDARAFALAELRLGAGRGAASMVGVALGTGVGGAIALDGRVYLGRNGDAGEIGHMTLDPGGPDCNCGSRGCLEAFLRADRIAAACGTSTVEEAVERAGHGDAAAGEGFRRVGRYLGMGIANVVVVTAAERVVVGGGVAAAGDLLLTPARDEVRHRFGETPLADVSIVTGELGTWAGAIGAAIHGAQREVARERPDDSGFWS